MPLFDDKLLRILPTESRQKIERLDADRDAAYAAMRAASDAVQEARREHTLSEAFARQRLALHPGISVDAHPAAAVLAEQTRQREQEAAEAKLLEPVHAAKRRLDVAIAAHQRAVAIWERFAFLETVATWLERVGAGVQLRHCAVPAPKAPKGGYAAEVDRIRREIEKLDAQWAAAEGAPAPKSDLLARAVAEIDDLAAKGEPTVHATSRGGSPINLAKQLSIAAQPIGNVATLVGDAGAAFWTWVLRDVLVNKITALIEALPDGNALDDDAREAEFARISARRLELERLEEACIVAAEQQGQAIVRRRDADPRAILEIAEA